MVRAGMCVAAGVFALAAAWVGVAHFEPVGAAQPPDAKAVDLTALRDAVDAAARKGENVDEIRTALDAYQKSGPKAAGRVTNELQALRDAVDAAAKKGENVEEIVKELARVETAAAGRALTKPKPEPQPRPNPIQRRPIAPELPFPGLPNPGLPNQLLPAVGGGVDAEMLNRATELHRKAIELMLKDPDDADAIREAEKLRVEAAELMVKAARGLAGRRGLGGMAPFPDLDIGRVPDVGRIPDRARLGIRLERVPPVAVEQLGLEPNIGITVTQVVAGSVAEKAGLKVHDIVLEFAGKAVTDNTEEFVRRVNAVRAGEKIDMVVMRRGKKVEVKGVELSGPPQPGAIPNGANPFQKAADALNGAVPIAPIAPVKPLNDAVPDAPPKPANRVPNPLAPVVPNPLPLLP